MNKKLVRTRSRPNDESPTALVASKSAVECGTVGSAPTALKLKRILVPLDFSAPSIKALKYAVPLAEQFGATICLVHVVEKASFVNDLDNVALAVPDEKLASIARENLISLSKKAIKKLIPVFPHARIGKPFE